MAGYTIVVDAMGGDNAPEAPVQGAAAALKENPDLSLILTGREPVLRDLLAKESCDPKRLRIVHTEEVVENGEHSPAEAVRKKKDSSLAVALRMLRDGKAQGFVSAGNTGAVLSGGTLIAGRIRGILRPALTLAIPVSDPPVVLLDVGANMDCKSAYLAQFARMGSIYCRKMFGLESPRVGLLNVGTEEGKGNALTREAYPLLQNDKRIHFVGNVEAREGLLGAADILVCDAFAGNVLLKTIEGTAGYILNTLKAEIHASAKAKVGAMFLMPTLKRLKARLDPSSVGGTPLLGVNGAVIKAHGNSDARAIASAIRQCGNFIASGVNEAIAGDLGSEPAE